MTLQEFTIAAGYAGLTAIIFSESGLLIGFFLPGDSLLFTAGFLASQGIFNIYWIIGLCFVAAVVGDSVGYTFGRRVGKKFFNREEGFFFRRERIEQAKFFYQRYGGKAIVLARFVPAIRTLAPIVAGVGDMHYPTFLAYNIVGGILWAMGLTALGYFFGSTIPGVDKYILPVVGLIILTSVIPVLHHILKDSRRRQVVFKKLIWWRK